MAHGPTPPWSGLAATAATTVTGCARFWRVDMVPPPPAHTHVRTHLQMRGNPTAPPPSLTWPAGRRYTRPNAWPASIRKVRLCQTQPRPAPPVRAAEYRPPSGSGMLSYELTCFFPCAAGRCSGARTAG